MKMAKVLRICDEMEKLIFTIEIAIKELPDDAHPAHRRRLEELKKDLERAC